MMESALLSCLAGTQREKCTNLYSIVVQNTLTILTGKIFITVMNELLVLLHLLEPLVIHVVDNRSEGESIWMGGRWSAVSSLQPCSVNVAEVLAA